jgi:D-arabinose 1-dehydrogenase-like Zn-dependent alcohol dehydrogenase
MSTYKAAVLDSANHMSLKQLPHRDLRFGEVLVKVETCGCCHGDSAAVEGHVPGMKFPRVPGHEIVGLIEKIGDGVPSSRGLSVGQRVGRGWHGGHCFGCDMCIRGDFLACKNALVTGLTTDGGYTEYVYASWQSLAIIPPEVSSANASALMCAGLTVFNGLRLQHIMPPGIVAVHGIGGLGHLAIQFAARMGYTVVAVSSGSSKEALAKQLGAKHYIDTAKQDAVTELKALGGAAAIIATSFSSQATASLHNGLATKGVLLVLGADHHGLNISPLQLIQSRGQIVGHASGHPAEAEDTLKFAAEHGIETMVETFSLDQFQQAYDHMMKGSPKFRVVIDCTGTH